MVVPNIPKWKKLFKDLRVDSYSSVIHQAHLYKNFIIKSVKPILVSQTLVFDCDLSHSDNLNRIIYRLTLKKSLILYFIKKHFSVMWKGVKFYTIFYTINVNGKVSIRIYQCNFSHFKWCLSVRPSVYKCTNFKFGKDITLA